MEFCCDLKSLAIVALAVLCLTAASMAAPKTLVVEAGDRARAWVPVCVDLPEGMEGKRAVITDGGRTVPSQVCGGKLWFVVEKLDAGASKSYGVTFVRALEKKTPGVEVTKGEKALDISIAGKPFTSYVFKPETIGKAVLRRPYFFPVHGPGQTPMTRPYPMVQEGLAKNVHKDHPHHTSIYVAHGAVNGVDNWSIGGRAGYIVHKDFEMVEDGPVVGTFRETLDWTTKDKKPVAAEVRTVRVYNLPDTTRLLDIDITFQAKYGPIKFGDTKEGGLCASRMRPEFRHDKSGDEGMLINSEGDKGKAAWGKKARWVDCSGLVDGERLGFTIFDGPDNLRHPTTWHARTYGLLTANPFGLSHFTRGKEKGDFEIDEGGERTWRYRIYFHKGTAAEAKADARWHDFAKPPAAAWK